MVCAFQGAAVVWGGWGWRRDALPRGSDAPSRSPREGVPSRGAAQVLSSPGGGCPEAGTVIPAAEPHSAVPPGPAAGIPAEAVTPKLLGKAGRPLV